MRETPGTVLVEVPAGGAWLRADLDVRAGARGVVLFAHGSGSGRGSPRNRRVAAALREAGFGTLLVDLLAAREEALDHRAAEVMFDIPVLTRRVVAAVDWLAAEPSTRDLPIGIFGASTGAAAALAAAAERPDAVAAVVSRGGRPDLAARVLPDVVTPTLLIVGTADVSVLVLNERAMGRLRGTAEIALVRGAGHLFEEPGALEEVCRLTAAFFRRHLRS